MTNGFRSSYITSQSRCTETSYLPKKKRKDEECSGEWNRGKKRKDGEKRREEVGNVVISSTFIARAKQIYGT